MKIQFNILEAISNYPNPEKLTGQLKKARTLGLAVSCVFFVIASASLLFVLPIDNYKEMWPQVIPIILKLFIAVMFVYNCFGLAKGFILRAYPFNKYRYDYGEVPATGIAGQTVSVLLIHALGVQQILTLFLERKLATSPFVLMGSFVFNYCLVVCLITFYMKKSA